MVNGIRKEEAAGDRFRGRHRTAIPVRLGGAVLGHVGLRIAAPCRMELYGHREPDVSHRSWIVHRIRHLLLALEEHASLPDLDCQPGGAGGGGAGRRVSWPRASAMDFGS